MYVYDCNAILTTAINIRSDKEMMQAFTELNEDLKSCGINTDFHFIDNEASPPIILYPHIWIILFQKLTVSTTWDKSSNL